MTPLCQTFPGFVPFRPEVEHRRLTGGDGQTILMEYRGGSDDGTCAAWPPHVTRHVGRNGEGEFGYYVETEPGIATFQVEMWSLDDILGDDDPDDEQPRWAFWRRWR